MFVCLSVCVFTFEVPFKRLLAPPSQSWMSNFFKEIRNPRGIVIERSGLRILINNEGCKIAAQNKKNANLGLINH